MNLYDAVQATGVRRTADGYLVADVRVARTGIQEYLGSEVGRPDLAFVRVYRPEAEVFSKDAMHSYAHRPMTNNHPGSPVTAENWKDVAIGQTGDEVIRDGEFVRVPLVLMDAAAIKQFEDGKHELSMGYSAEIVFQDGTTPDGQHYDAVQTQLRMNHLALVDKARGGDKLRIGDGRTPGEKDRADTPPTEKSEMSDTKTRTILVDGLSVETTDAGAQAIAKLQGQIKDADAARQTLEDAHAKAIAAKDADLAKKDAKIDELQKKVLSDADLDKRVKERSDLIATAKLIADADYTGKSEAEIRKLAVSTKLGDSAIADKAEAYIAARFDILAEDAAKTDPVRSALMTGPARQAVQDNGYAASVNDLDYRTRNAKKEA